MVYRYLNDTGAEQGKTMQFHYTNLESTSPSGLPIASVLTSFYKSDYFKKQSSKSKSENTSPDQVISCPDNKQSLYCHLLCGLSQRDRVVKVSAAFAHNLVRAFAFLESNWKELCSNIRTGQVSEWINDLDCRTSVSAIIKRPNPELAGLIEYECNHKSMEGIIKRLWPKTKFIECIITGQMAQYIPILKYYSDKLPLVSTAYGSSESIFGINLDPLCNPQDVSYTFVSNTSYFEFLPIDHEGDMTNIVDLVDVKLGCYYEPVVTTYFGLNRYRIGDVLQVTGFYNATPQFRFVRRKNKVLSVETEVTNEEDILKALTHATSVLESSNLMLMDFTCYTDISTFPGHYVFYWELKAKEVSDINELDETAMMKCCSVIEESFDEVYRVKRKSGLIGALEIKVVQLGTFDSLMEYFISRGGSMAQYKTPISVNSSEALAVLESKVLARFYTPKSPPLDS